MSQIRQTIGHQLRRYRKAKGLTQAQLAEASQISVDSVWAIEREKSTASFETLEQLCEVLNVTVADLITPVSAPDSATEEELQEVIDILRVRSPEDVRFVRDVVRTLFKRIDQP